MAWLEILLRLLAGVLLVAANAFFVVTEFALTRLRSLGKEAIEGHAGLELAWEMTDRLEIYLTSCQLGITTTSILMGVVTEPAVSHLLRPALGVFGITGRTLSVTSVVVAVVVINLIHKIWGEQTPTYLGIERPRVAGFTGPVLYWWTKILYPVIMLGDGLAKRSLGLFGVEIERSWTDADEAAEDHERPLHTYGELREAMGQVLSRGSLSRERRREVLRALEIQRIPVRDVMVPREEIAALAVNRSFEENLETLRRHPVSRFPLIGDDLDDFRGIVYLPAVVARYRDLERGETTLQELAAEPLSVAADCQVSRLIDLFQEHHQELALVTEDGEVVGLVTATDAFETIAGELEDPLDVEG